MHPGCSRRSRLPCLSITHKYFSGRCLGKLTGRHHRTSRCATESIRVAWGLSASLTFQLPTNILAECARCCKAQVNIKEHSIRNRDKLARFGIQSPGFEPRHGHVRRGNDFFKASGVDEATRLIDVCLKAALKSGALRNSNQSTLTGYTMWILNLPLRRPYTFIVLARISS